jgi:hypothetical protein
MRRTIPLIIIFFLLVMSGCNLTLQPTSVQPTIDVLGTQVSKNLTLTAEFTSPVVTTPIPASSATALPTQKATEPPAATTAPSQTVEASASPTNTPSVEASSTASTTPTSTGIPGDPITSLGQPDWKDNFQKASTWGLQSPYDDGHTRVSIDPGKLVLMSYNADGWLGWRMMNIKIKNFYLQTTIQTLTCSGSDMYGIIFRSPDNNKAYWLSITCDGHYSLEVGDINALNTVIESKTSALINAGSNQSNRFGIMAQGNKISIYANGKLVEEVTNDTLLNAGSFGYYIAGNKTAGFTVEATEIAYWNLP